MKFRNRDSLVLISTGFVYIWDLSNSDDVPLSISPISGAMSPYAVSFVSMHDGLFLQKSAGFSNTKT